MNDKGKKKGLIIVFTGAGKGKTTAAMGMALRGAGHGLRTIMIQFIKGSWQYGELEASKRLLPHMEIIPMGRGFIYFKEKGPDPEDIRAVNEAWDLAREKIASTEYHMVILDEINYAMDYRLVDRRDVLHVLKTKPETLHVVLTGRNAPQDILDAADLVTEMKDIKHPYKQGVKAQKGIEF